MREAQRCVTPFIKPPRASIKRFPMFPADTSAAPVVPQLLPLGWPVGVRAQTVIRGRMKVIWKTIGFKP